MCTQSPMCVPERSEREGNPDLRRGSVELCSRGAKIVGCAPKVPHQLGMGKLMNL